MVNLIGNFLNSGGFIPHGHCYLWQPELVWLHVVSDSLIALSYYSIPVTLLYFVSKRQDLPFDWIFLLFGMFIIACGTTHLMEVWTLWHPTYWLSGTIKLMTASVSLYTAAMLVPVVPKALILPNPEQLEAANRSLEQEIAERQQAEAALRQSEARYRAIVEDQTELIIRYLPDSTTLFVNGAFCRYFELNQDEMIGKSYAPRIHEEDREKVATRIQSMNFENPTTTVENRVIVGEEIRWTQWNNRMIFDNQGRFVEYQGVGRDITERKQAEDQLQATNAQMLALFAAMDDLVMVRNAQGRCMDILTPRASHLLYKPAEEMLGRTLHETFPQNVAAPLYDYVQQALQTQQPAKADYCLTIRGRETWLSASISPIDTSSVIWVIRDMSAQHAALRERIQAEEQIKLSLKEKEVLLKEIHHRVKNNLQIVDSLLQMQSRRLSDRRARAILTDSRNRIASIALVHEKLYRSADLANIAFAQYVPDLTAHLFDSYNISSSAVSLNTDISDIALEIETAIPCGLIINELVSNSLKYAFPANRPGEILVKFYTSAHHALTLIVRDNGIGMPTKFNLEQTKSLGLTLVQNLVEQLEGTLELNCTQGTEFRISFPKNRTGL